MKKFFLMSMFALLAFALYAGRGMMRLFALLGMGLGAMLWFLTLSPLALRLFGMIWAVFGRILRLICAPVRGILKIFLIFFKKVFATARKWVTIIDKVFRTAQSRRAGKEGQKA